MRRYAALFSLLLLSGCATFQHGADVPHAGSTPTLGERQRVSVGEVMVAEFNYRVRAGARLVDTVPHRALTSIPEWPAGTLLSGGVSGGYRTFCTGQTPWNVCFQDRDEDGLFEHWLIWNGYGALNAATPLDPPVAYRAEPLPVGSGFRYELLYQGRSDNVVNIAYREYSGDYARPAFQQDLRYTLQAGAPTDIAFRGVRARIFSADNEGIEYEVTSGFQRAAAPQVSGDLLPPNSPSKPAPSGANAFGKRP